VELTVLSMTLVENRRQLLSGSDFYSVSI
jgi:hypothetical protein